VLSFLLLQNMTGNSTNCGYCGNACGAGQTCMSSVCAESSVGCGKAKAFSGNEGDFSFQITIGTGGPNFKFTYNAYSFPDRFNVFLPNGTRIFTKLAGTPGFPSSSCKCGKCMSEMTYKNDFVMLPRPTGVSSVRVVVNGYCAGTQWTFTAGCAQ
jgi:hypothetical protein